MTAHPPDSSLLYPTSPIYHIELFAPISNILLWLKTNEGLLIPLQQTYMVNIILMVRIMRHQTLAVSFGHYKTCRANDLTSLRVVVISTGWFSIAASSERNSQPVPRMSLELAVPMNHTAYCKLIRPKQFNEEELRNMV